MTITSQFHIEECLQPIILSSILASRIKTGLSGVRIYPDVRAYSRSYPDRTDLRALEEALVQDPRAGKVERGLGGARKIRVRLPGRGKRGGARVVYHYSERKARVYLLLAYAKTNRPVLTQRQRKVVRDLIAELEGG